MEKPCWIWSEILDLERDLLLRVGDKRKRESLGSGRWQLCRTRTQLN